MRSKIGIAVSIILSMLLLYTGIGFCQEKVSGSQWTQIVEQMGDKGKINWSEGYVEAKGIGAPPERYIGKPPARPMALRAARVDAYRNLLETTKGVRVDSATLVKDYTVESDAINTQVEGLVKGAKVVKQEYLSDGTVEVTMRMPIYLSPEEENRLGLPGFSKIIINKILEKKPAVTPPAPVPVAYTGMVVDARGLQARPAMSPKIFDESGREVYGSMNVDREYAVQQGMSGYARELTAAQSNSRVTTPPLPNPVIVKGIKATGASKTDIVISNADADKIRDASFLRECRVMIVLD